MVVFDGAAVVFTGTILMLGYQQMKKRQYVLFKQFGIVYSLFYVVAMHTCGYTSLFPRVASRLSTKQFDGMGDALILLSGFSVLTIIGSAVFANMLLFCVNNKTPFFIKEDDPKTEKGLN